MDHQFCPGAKVLRQPKPEFFSCPRCGTEVEIWSDERKRPCPSCGEIVLKDAGEDHPSCLDWCAMGRECVGDTTYDRYLETKSENIKTRLLRLADGWNNSDSRRDDLLAKVLPNIEAKTKRNGGDPYIVLPAFILSCTKERWAESTGKSPEEFANFVKKILLREGLQMEAIDEIVQIVSGREKTGETCSVNSTIVQETLKEKIWRQ